jgi:hypothetical protein
MTKNKFYLVILALVGQLFSIGQVASEPLEASEHASEEIFLSVSAPDRDRLSLVSLLPVIVEGAVVGRLAAYDDDSTRRAADYLELYDSAGHLLALGWFDKFGIQRTAIDRGLLKGAAELEGVFVILTDGDAI